MAEEYKNAEARKKQWEIEAAERRKQDMEKEKQRAEDKRKIEFVISASEYWKQSKILEEFCNSLNEACQNRILADEQKKISQEIISLLTSYIQKINPLNSISDLLEDFESGCKWLSRYY